MRKLAVEDFPKQLQDMLLWVVIVAELFAFKSWHESVNMCDPLLSEPHALCSV